MFLILGNLRVHHSKIAKAWIAERKVRYHVPVKRNRTKANPYSLVGFVSHQDDL